MGQSKFFLTTERLGFDTWQTGLTDEARQLWGNSQVTKLISSNDYTDEQIRHRLSKEINLQESFNFQYWPIYLLEGGEFCGCCGFHPSGEDSMELGYHLLPRYWGAGLATEAAKGAIEYAREELTPAKIVAGHHPENTSSGKVLFKLGFKRIEDQYYEPTGLMHPTYILGPNSTETKNS